MRTKLISLVVCAVLVGGGYYWWVSTPIYSLRQIQNAIENHDAALFEKYVDIETFSSRFIDDILASSIREAEGGEGLGEALAAGFIQLLKPRLIEAVREQVIRFVEQGDLEEGDRSNDDVTLVGVSEELGVTLDSFRGISYTRTEGKVAFVGVDFRNDQLDADHTIELKLRAMGGYWRLTELSNLQESIKLVRDLQSAPTSAP